MNMTTSQDRDPQQTPQFSNLPLIQDHYWRLADRPPLFEFATVEAYSQFRLSADHPSGGKTEISLQHQWRNKRRSMDMTASECKRSGKFVKPEEDAEPALLGSHSGKKPLIAAALRAAVLRETSGFESPPQRLIYNCSKDLKSFSSKETNTIKQQSKLLKQNCNPHINTSPKLIVLCGPTHSGKSSFAGELKGFVIVNSDRIRKEITGESKLLEQESLVWKTFSSHKSVAIKARRDIILDACHISPGSRWHALNEVKNNYRKICIVIDLPWDEIEKRCLMEKRINLETAREMWKAFQKSKPSAVELMEEGFDEAYFVNSPYLEKEQSASKQAKGREHADSKDKEVKP